MQVYRKCFTFCYKMRLSNNEILKKIWTVAKARNLARKKKTAGKRQWLWPKLPLPGQHSQLYYLYVTVFLFTEYAVNIPTALSFGSTLVVIFAEGPLKIGTFG